MKRSTIMWLLYVSTVAFGSTIMYHLGMAIDGALRESLVDSGDTTYYPPVERFDYFINCVMFMAVATLLFYIFNACIVVAISYYIAKRERNNAIAQIEDTGGEVVNSEISVALYGFTWYIDGFDANGSMFCMNDKVDLLADIPFIRS